MHAMTTRGFTLAEALITIGLAVVLLSVFTSVFASVAFLRRAQYNVHAAGYVQEEFDTLRSLPYAELLNRTNGRFLGVAMTRGPWQVKTVTAPPSGTNAYAMETAQTAIVEETGLAILPGDYREDFTFSAKVQAQTSSPAGWGAGIAFRYRDAENHYRFRINNGGVALDKIVQGTRTTIWSNSTSNSTGSWYTLEVTMTDATIVVRRNGTILTTQTDATFQTGDLALLTMNGGLAYFDDVSVTEGAATAWNFDGDAAGTVPDDWQRMSVADMPSGTGTLTIADYLGDNEIKQVTATVTWNDGDETRSLVGTTLIAE